MNIKEEMLKKLRFITENQIVFSELSSFYRRLSKDLGIDPDAKTFSEGIVRPNDGTLNQLNFSVVIQKYLLKAQAFSSCILMLNQEFEFGYATKMTRYLKTGETSIGRKIVIDSLCEVMGKVPFQIDVYLFECLVQFQTETGSLSILKNDIAKEKFILSLELLENPVENGVSVMASDEFAKAICKKFGLEFFKEFPFVWDNMDRLKQIPDSGDEKISNETEEEMCNILVLVYILSRYLDSKLKEKVMDLLNLDG